jgi:hypothetical protein
MSIGAFIQAFGQGNSPYQKFGLMKVPSIFAVTINLTHIRFFIFEFDLNGNMMNGEQRIHFLLNRSQETFARVALGQNQMGCHCRFARTHRPNVQVMYSLHTRQ